MMKSIFVENNSDNLKKKILNKLEKYNVCVLKNFIQEDKINKIFNILKKRNKNNKDIRLSGKFFYKMNDYKRLDIGECYTNPRFARFILLNEWKNKNKNFFNLVKPMINFRNNLSGISKDKYHVYHNLEKRKNNRYHFCDLVRMIQYPSGGGFLNCHNDYDPFYPDSMINMLMPVTSKITKSKNLKTYETGGLYYMINKKLFLIDDYIHPGDLIFHNQKIDHGVKTIDPYNNLNLNSLNGRVTINFSIGKFYI
jgi:hypothetical protein